MNTHTCNAPTRRVPGSYWYAYGSVAEDLVGSCASAPSRSYLRVLDGGERETGPASIQGYRTRPRAQTAQPTHSRSALDVIVTILLVGALVFIVTATCLLPGDVPSTADIAAVPVEIVSVAHGDTLWSLSEQHPIDGLTTRQCVQWIMERNGLESTLLTPGQAIWVPCA